MRILLVNVFAVAAMYAQINTGSITGTVHDPGGLAVAGAEVTLANPLRGLERRSTTNASGDFVFPGMEAGVYNLLITSPGFKRTERQGITLPAGERLALGVVSLEIGAISEKIVVTAEGAIVQTQSAERAGTITSSQVENLQILGRNVPSLVGLLPGVVMLAEPQGLDRATTFSAQGGRNNQNQVSVDGLPSTDLGNGFELKLQQSMDSVAEVRILLSNYQAEYGNSAGANVEMILKSGTQQFHGLGSYFRRHEMFNANDFFNNRLGIPKPRYRFHTWTYNIGGPIFIPGKFNANKDKLFFFWSQEFWPRKTSGTFTRTMPTELERNGDFSQSLDLNNRLITIRDPQAGSPFPGNRIPSNRFNPSS